MKILFLAFPLFNLYEPVEKELIRQGHIVHTITDRLLPFDYNIVASSKIKRFAKRVIRSVSRVEKRYWASEIRKDPLIGQYYDELLCYQGISMSKYLLKYLRKFNPDIKTCAYIWDSSSYYNFFSRKKLFDRIFTYDISDANNVSGVNFLDPYWVEQPGCTCEILYDISSIGSDHDGRYEFTLKFFPQLADSNLSSFIRVFSRKPDVSNFSQDEQKTIIANWKKRMEAPFMTQEPIPFPEVDRIIHSSNCVIEIDRKNQAGMTVRSLSAIANGRKVISTNQSLKDRPFYNPNQIAIIDRDNPVLNLTWIQERQVFPIPDSLKELRIDYWVRNLII